MTDPHYATRRQTDAALHHEERDLAPVRAPGVPRWAIIAGCVLLGVVGWWFGVVR